VSWLVSVTDALGTTDPVDLHQDGNKIELSVTGHVETTLLKIMNINEFNLTIDNEVTRSANNIEVAKETNTLFVAVKPNVVLPALRDLAPHLKDKLVISLAAGVRLPAMESVADARFMRALTNTPSANCQGATALTHGARSTKEDFLFVRNLFETVGVVMTASFWLVTTSVIPATRRGHKVE